MSKSIKISTKDGKDYTITYTRKTVTIMSQNGFKIEDVRDTPITGIPQLFAGAFLRYHRNIKQELVDEIWASIPNKEDFILALIDMYQEPIEALIDEPEDETKNSKWEIIS